MRPAADVFTSRRRIVVTAVVLAIVVAVVNPAAGQSTTTPNDSHVLAPPPGPVSRPKVSIWTFLTNNRLSLALRFRGLKKAFREELNIGPLKISGLAGATVKTVGTRKVDGETLPIVLVEYVAASTSAQKATASLGSSRGTVQKLSLRVATRIYDKSRTKTVLTHLEAGDLEMQLEGITGDELTNFGPLHYSVPAATLDARESILVKQEWPANEPPERWATGALGIVASDLRFTDLAFTFEGDDNQLRMSTGISMPSQLDWQYQLDRGRWLWNEGTIQVADLQLVPVPARPINFGGITLDLNGLVIGSARVTRAAEAGGTPRVEMADLKIDATRLAANEGLRGRLAAPVTIGHLEGQLTVKNNSIEEGLNLSNLRVRDVALNLADMKYSNANGLDVSANSFSLTLAEYKRTDAANGNKEETNINARITLQGGALKGPANVTVENLEADLRGPSDRFNGKGQMTVQLSDFATTVEIDPKKTIPTLSCDGGIRPLQIDVSQIGAARFTSEVFFFEGLPTARTTADSIAFNFNPKYWRCEWDSRVGTLKVPTVTWDTPRLKWDRWRPYIEWGGVHIGSRDETVDVHWIAELQPVPGAGAVLLPDIKFDKDGLKLCGGHTAMLGGFWLPQIGPNLRDCGNLLCNIPRDALRGAWAAAEAPFGLLTGSLANTVVNSAGFFDAGLLTNRCK